jgi:hypothetical protein
MSQTSLVSGGHITAAAAIAALPTMPDGLPAPVPAAPAAVGATGGAGHAGPGSVDIQVQLWGPCTSVHARFPGIPIGIRLVNKIFEVYGREVVNTAWYDTDSRELLVPHPDNIRHHDITIEDYIILLLKYGLNQDCRGQPWAVLSRENKPPYLMLSWGTLVRAVYAAARKYPHNKNIEETLKMGVTNIKLLDWRTPKDCRPCLLTKTNS